MRTIGHHYKRNAPRNDQESSCDYCGVAYPRSDLRKDRAGLLACEKDYGGDIVTLGEAIAQAAQERRGAPPIQDAGAYRTDPVDTPPVVTYPDGARPISG